MLSSTMDSVTSTRGKNKLIHDGYVYVKKNDLANGVMSYECELPKKAKHNNRQSKTKVSFKWSNNC